MAPPEVVSASFFQRHRKKTLVVVWLLLMATAEGTLRVYAGRAGESRPNPFVYVTPPGGKITDELTHHSEPPNVHRVRTPGPHDTFEPSDWATNSLGIRGPEIGPKARPRVLIVGDSFIEADEVKFEQTFSETLNREFEGKLQFIAHGVSSWAPTPEFSWIYHRGLSFGPDEVCLFLVFNDFFPSDIYIQGNETYESEAVWQDGAPVRYVPPDVRSSMDSSVYRLEQRALRVLGKLEIVKLSYAGCRSIAAAISPPMSEQDPILLFAKDAREWPGALQRSVDQTIDVVARLDAYLRQKNVRLSVTLVPDGFNWPDELMGVKTYSPEWSRIVSNAGLPADKFVVSDEGLERFVSAQLSQKGVQWFSLRPAFDAAKAVSRALLYNEEDGHWNWRGHAVVAGVLESRYAHLAN